MFATRHTKGPPPSGAGRDKIHTSFSFGQTAFQHHKELLAPDGNASQRERDDFHLFLSLIDPDRFEGTHGKSQQAVDVSDVMRRLVKEELLKFDGTPLFPERIAYTVNYDLSDMEAKLYAAVTDYVQEEFNRADNLNNERKTTVGFALTILQRPTGIVAGGDLSVTPQTAGTSGAQACGGASW